MFRKLVLLATLTVTAALPASVTIGTFEWIPFNDDVHAIFKVTPYSGDVSNDVVDAIKLENLRLVLHVWNSAGDVDLGLRAFTLYSGYSAADAINPGDEPGNSNYNSFPRVTTQPPSSNDLNNRYSRKFLIPGSGDIRITQAYLDYSGAAVVPQSTWTLNNGSEFLPNLAAVYVQIGNGMDFFSYGGSPIAVNLTVEGTVVPEPSTIALAVGGLAAIVVRRRFKR